MSHRYLLLSCFHSLLSEILYLFVPPAHPWSNPFIVHWMRIENQGNNQNIQRKALLKWESLHGFILWIRRVNSAYSQLRGTRSLRFTMKDPHLWKPQTLNYLKLYGIIFFDIEKGYVGLLGIWIDVSKRAGLQNRLELRWNQCYWSQGVWC